MQSLVQQAQSLGGLRLLAHQAFGHDSQLLADQSEQSASGVQFKDVVSMRK